MITLNDITKAASHIHSRNSDKLLNPELRQIVMSLRVYIQRGELQDVTNNRQCIKCLQQAGYEVKGYE